MSPALTDRFGRAIRYLRVSVTDRCDLRCAYCIPEHFKDFEAPEDWLTPAELERVVRAFARLGVARVRLTGGEPLTRGNIADLAARIAAIPGIEDLSLSTNATRLARHAAALKRAGIARLNVSLDSLRGERLERITGRDCLGDVLAGLKAAKMAGFSPIKLNTVVLPGVNDDEIDDLVAFSLVQGFILRLIETMPMGETGRAAGFLDLQPIQSRLRARFGLVDGVQAGGGPARYLQSPDGKFSVGFITPLSQHFCDNCNRVRLAVDGRLHLCLGQEHALPLRPLLRGGATETELEAAIRHAIDLKPERHEFREAPEKTVRIMAKTGG